MGDLLKLKNISANAYSIDTALSKRAMPIVVSIVSAAGFETSSSNGIGEELDRLDKIAQFIMTKKSLAGISHMVVDLAYGENMIIKNLSDAKLLREKMEKLAKKLEIKIRVLIYKTIEPAGRGVGPILEQKDILKVLEQTSDRPVDLEVRSLNLACSLLEICLEDADKKTQDFVKVRFANVYNWTLTLLQKGVALEKYRQLIKAEGKNPNIKSSDLKMAKANFEIKAIRAGIVSSVNVKNLLSITRILGAPISKTSGIYLNKKIGESVNYGEPLFTLFAENVYNLKEGKQSLKNFPILTYR